MAAGRNAPKGASREAAFKSSRGRDKPPGQKGKTMKQVLYINAEREGYAIDQIRNTMTVGELISYLK